MNSTSGFISRFIEFSDISEAKTYVILNLNNIISYFEVDRLGEPFYIVEEDISKVIFHKINLGDEETEDETQQCEICYTNKKKIKLEKCNHQYCYNCYNNINKCGFCRSEDMTYQALIFPIP